MKIAVVIPNSAMPPEAVERRRLYLQSSASRDTELLFWRNSAGPASIETEAERDEAGVEIFRHAMGRDLSKISALIPWCAADPGLDALRQALPIPVVGPLIAACRAASLSGHRFSLVMPAGSPGMMRHRIASYGFGPKLVSVRQVDRPVLQLRTDIENTKRLFAQQIDAAVDDGADAVILGCMALFGLAQQIRAAVPVIDPALAALTAAESMVRLRLARSAAW
jgi:allantoin racemase